MDLQGSTQGRVSLGILQDIFHLDNTGGMGTRDTQGDMACQAGRLSKVWEDILWDMIAQDNMMDKGFRDILKDI